MPHLTLVMLNSDFQVEIIPKEQEVEEELTEMFRAPAREVMEADLEVEAVGLTKVQPESEARDK